jgi:CBS-domain-containing membrane protein
VKRTVSDVMTRTVVVVSESAPFKNVVRRMHEYRVSALPVVDDEGRLVGIVSEADLILKEDPELEEGARLFEGPHRRHERRKAAGLTSRQLMTSPVVTVGPGATLGEAAGLMHRRAVKRLPVVDGSGRILGILSRADLLKVFLRDDGEIEREVREDVIRRTLWIDPDTVSVAVRDGVARLEGQLERRSLIPMIEQLVTAVEGVVGVEEHLSFLVDDTVPTPEIPTPWTAVGRS